MNEIKFRAWNITNGQSVPPMTIQEMIYQRKNEFSLEQLNAWFIFEQYTGFKDISGTEIYEGDEVGYMNINTDGCRFIVVRENGNFILYNPNRQERFNIDWDKVFISNSDFKTRQKYQYQ